MNKHNSKITLSMIVKNEERYLRDCLESVKDIVDEIILVDTGSTDSTISIAKKYGASVYSFGWVNDFSAARNFALSKSTGNWILYLDADERLSESSKIELQELIKNKKNIGYNCIINNLDEQTNTPKLMKYVRFFRNSKNIAFSGKAHEQIEPSLIANNYKIINSTIEITHLGYNVCEEELMLKADRNLELLLSEYKNKPNSYLAYQIANSYSILKEKENSVRYFRIALEKSGLKRELQSVCYLHLADFEMRESNIQKAQELVEKGLGYDRNHPLLNMVAAQVYEKLNDQNASLKHCKNAFELNLKQKSNTNSNNVLDIIIDDSKIILEGILLSLKFNNQEMREYYLNHLQYIDTNLFKNVKNVVENELLSDGQIENLISYSKKENLEIILKLLKRNTNNNSKLIFFSKIFDQFCKDPLYLLNFGTFLLDTNQIEEAQVILELALNNENFDDSVIFYLASIYTTTNNIQALLNLLQKASKKAENDTLFRSKLDLLLVKLQPILS